MDQFRVIFGAISEFEFPKGLSSCEHSLTRLSFEIGNFNFQNDRRLIGVRNAIEVLIIVSRPKYKASSTRDLEEPGSRDGSDDKLRSVTTIDEICRQWPVQADVSFLSIWTIGRQALGAAAASC
jgi:hypothetical protein